MAPRLHLPVFLLLLTILLAPHIAKSDDTGEILVQEINSYRVSLNLSVLRENKNADCLAEQLAEQLKNQDCTNTTGANTVPGTENQLANYPDFLARCHLNISNTRDGVVMPACVPGLTPSIVLTNFTHTQYSGNLNDSQYSGVGIASERDWVVVVLTTNTTDGSFENYNVAGKFHLQMLPLLFCLLLVLMSYFC
eukprot:TRINITY_DN7097_c0_g2_i1.p2 TRINITY_DN7097_c0_g2~~TRINITY_DN7097_c0_g2_i1.p2  ORF type:complete len:194 (+),score=21.61 TRINITY_DN7097_c0_g2_i1:242-823(+)